MKGEQLPFFNDCRQVWSGLALCHTMYYNTLVMDVDWTHGSDQMLDRHGVRVEWANEALADPDALRIDPDPSSRSGRSVRTIGYSTLAGCLLSVITLTEDNVIFGVNGWKSNDIDIGRYGEDMT